MVNFTQGKIAASAALIQDNKILLLKRSDEVKLFPGFWTLPAGKIEESDESVASAVVREVKEETGLHFEPSTKLNFFESVLEGKRNFSLVYLGRWSGEIKLQESEVQDCMWCTYQEAVEKDLAFADRGVVDELKEEGLIG